MGFDDYAGMVNDALNTWLDALLNGHPKVRVDSLKEDAENLIGGWKDAFPKQQTKISDFVREKINARLK